MSEMLDRVAKALHASLGYEHRWPEPECTQCMDAARAAILAMSEWQPIETAPKDGRRLILHWSTTGYVDVRYWRPGQERWWGFPDSDPRYDPDLAIKNVPTHWMPLPKPPKP
jgi:hypothetical protein